MSALCRKHSFSVCVCSPDGAHSDESAPDASQAIYAEFDDDFEDEELAAPIGKCTAMYNFPGMSSGGLSRFSRDVFLNAFFLVLRCQRGDHRYAGGGGTGCSGRRQRGWLDTRP